MAETIIVDYGVGNTANVARAFRHLGVTVRVSSGAHDIAGAARLVLPGVGSFAAGMRGLRERGLAAPLAAAAAAGVPVLGICLGMQLLFTRGFEFGEKEGLGLIAGEVIAFAPDRAARVPHIGWAELQPPAAAAWPGTVLADLAPGSHMYFVHSFYPQPADTAAILATSTNGDTLFCSAVHQGSLWGMQFHPELSGPAGLRIIAAFARLGAQ